MAEILRALFPCGSVTGAPKIRAMEILHELETSPRGAYCGAIGYFAPDGSARFNVAIRTLTIAGGQGELGIGGGVVQDSDAAQRICRMPAEGAVLRSGAPAAGTDRDPALGKRLCPAGRASGADAASAAVFGLAFDADAGARGAGKPRLPARPARCGCA